MKVLELFAGSRSIGRMAESMGHEVCSVDIHPFDGIDIVKDIEHLTIQDLPWKPQMIWASPPCTTYSIMSVSHHRNGNEPTTEFAQKSDALVKNVLKLVGELDCAYYIENPRGMLRTMKWIHGIDRRSVTYCTYGDIRMKVTDIWSNNFMDLFNTNGWNPRPLCFNGNEKCHHQPAPRGSRTGTQGIMGNYERSRIPDELCREIIKATQQKFI